MSNIKLYFKEHPFFKGLLITILILFGLRIFYSIPTPGINTSYFKELVAQNSALGLLDLFTGNGLSNISVMTLNITPYITASIIIQLLSNVFKRLDELRKGMRDEQKKLERITISLGVALASAEGVAMAVGFGRRGLFNNYTWYWVVIAVLVWSAGTAAASILGKRVQEKYKLNGTSLILVSNILAGYLSDGWLLYDRFVAGEKLPLNVLFGVIILCIIVALFAFTYFVQDSERPVKVQYAGKSNFMNNSQSSDFPIKLCPGSVVPIIFASSLMTTPVLIASAFSDTTSIWAKILSSNYWCNPTDWLPSIGILLYIVLIFAFSIFYADMTLDAKDIADKFKKSGGVIPGIRPGKATETFLRKKIHNTVNLGAVALIIIALIPIILSGLFSLSRISFLGTSVIIVVGVLVELRNQIRANLKEGTYHAVPGKGLF